MISFFYIIKILENNNCFFIINQNYHIFDIFVYGPDVPGGPIGPSIPCGPTSPSFHCGPTGPTGPIGPGIPNNIKSQLILSIAGIESIL